MTRGTLLLTCVNQADIQGAFFQILKTAEGGTVSEANPYIYLFYPQGLDAEMKYEDVATGKRYTGAALMKAGLPLPLTTGDYQEIRFVFKAVEK